MKMIRQFTFTKSMQLHYIDIQDTLLRIVRIPYINSVQWGLCDKREIVSRGILHHIMVF